MKQLCEVHLIIRISFYETNTVSFPRHIENKHSTILGVFLRAPIFVFVYIPLPSLLSNPGRLCRESKHKKQNDEIETKRLNKTTRLNIGEILDVCCWARINRNNKTIE